MQYFMKYLLLLHSPPNRIPLSPLQFHRCSSIHSDRAIRTGHSTALSTYLFQTDTQKDYPIHHLLPNHFFLFSLQDLLTARFQEKNEALQDRKSTRLNSSHVAISYAVFCLKKKRRR